MPSQDSLSLLLITDEPGLSMEIQGAIAGEGRELITAHSAEAALRMLLRRDFALILMDFEMAGMDGFEVASAIRSRPRSRRIPILYLTAPGTNQLAMSRACSVGAADYLVRPADAFALKARIHLLLEYYEMGLELQEQSRLRRQAEAEIWKLSHVPESTAEPDPRLPKAKRSSVGSGSVSVLPHRDESAAALLLNILAGDLPGHLASVLGWLELLRSGRLDGSARDRALEMADREARAHARMLEDIVDTARILTGNLALRLRNIEPVTAVGMALESARPAAQTAGIVLEAELDPLAGPIRGDSRRLQQVVSQLISNSIKFTPSGGQVHIRLGLAGAYVEIGVADTGVGIGPELLSDLFDPFRPRNTAPPGSGRGLGLALARSLVELHGGTVHAESPGGGQGSTFTIRLPLAPETPAGSSRRSET